MSAVRTIHPNLDPYVRIASGPSATKAADALRLLEERRNSWPYPHIFSPPDSIRRNPAGSIVTPAVGTTAVILSFQVPQGFKFDLVGIMFGVYTTNMVPVGNPGDFTFSVSRNDPTSGTVLQGAYINDFSAFPFPLGSPNSYGCVPLPRSEPFGPTDVIRVEVNNLSGATGAPNYALAMLAGWLTKA